MSQTTRDNQGNAVQELQTILNVQVANWSLLGVKLHHYHWYVKGPQFFVLHEKFEELYNTAAGYVDELAERLLAIGGKPAGSMSDYLKLATISEASGESSAEQMVQKLTDDFAVLAQELKNGIEAASSQEDDASADLLTGILADVQKQSWMLSAFLGN